MYGTHSFLLYARQVAVLEAKEWARMHDKLATWRNPPVSKQAQIQHHKMELHQHSQNIVKNWSNTIEGHRQKRLQAHKVKEEKEEVKTCNSRTVTPIVCEVVIA